MKVSHGSVIILTRLKLTVLSKPVSGLVCLSIAIHTNCFYLVPGTEDPSGEHEQVTHGDKTRPYQEGEEAEHTLENGLDADENEDGQEEEKGRRHRD